MEVVSLDKKPDFDPIIQMVAMEQGMSVQEIKRSILEALDAGRNRPDPCVQAIWHSIPCEGKTPTLNEALTFFAYQLTENRSFF